MVNLEIFQEHLLYFLVYFIKLHTNMEFVEASSPLPKVNEEII